MGPWQSRQVRLTIQNMIQHPNVEKTIVGIESEHPIEQAILISDDSARTG